MHDLKQNFFFTISKENIGTAHVASQYSQYLKLLFIALLGKLLGRLQSFEESMPLIKPFSLLSTHPLQEEKNLHDDKLLNSLCLRMS